MNRYATSTTILLATLLFASQALALDGYRDRRGLFYGVTLGGASFKADIAGSKRNLGYTFGGKVGGGVSETLTLDGSLNFQLQDYDQSGIAVKTNSTEMLVGGNYFLTVDQAKNGLFLRGEVGLVSQTTEVLGRRVTRQVSLLAADSATSSSPPLTWPSVSALPTNCSNSTTQTSACFSSPSPPIGTRLKASEHPHRLKVGIAYPGCVHTKNIGQRLV